MVFKIKKPCLRKIFFLGCDCSWDQLFVLESLHSRSNIDFIFLCKHILLGTERAQLFLHSHLEPPKTTQSKINFFKLSESFDCWVFQQSIIGKKFINLYWASHQTKLRATGTFLLPRFISSQNSDGRKRWFHQERKKS